MWRGKEGEAVSKDERESHPPAAERSWRLGCCACASNDAAAACRVAGCGGDGVATGMPRVRMEVMEAVMWRSWRCAIDKTGLGGDDNGAGAGGGGDNGGDGDDDSDDGDDGGGAVTVLMVWKVKVKSLSRVRLFATS